MVSRLYKESLQSKLYRELFRTYNKLDNYQVMLTEDFQILVNKYRCYTTQTSKKSHTVASTITKVTPQRL